MKNLLFILLLLVPVASFSQDFYKSFQANKSELSIKIDKSKYHVFVQMVATDPGNKDLYLFLSKRKLNSFHQALAKARQEYVRHLEAGVVGSKEIDVEFIAYSAFRTYRWNYDYSVKVKFEYVKPTPDSTPELVLSVGYMYNSLHPTEKINGGSISLQSIEQIDAFINALQVVNIESFIAKK